MPANISSGSPGIITNNICAICKPNNIKTPENPIPSILFLKAIWPSLVDSCEINGNKLNANIMTIITTNIINNILKLFIFILLFIYVPLFYK